VTGLAIPTKIFTMHLMTRDATMASDISAADASVQTWKKHEF
jgi:hypothetical protein